MSIPNIDNNITNRMAARAIANIESFCHILNEAILTLKFETGYFPTITDIIQLNQSPSVLIGRVNEFLDKELDDLAISNNIMRTNLKRGVESHVQKLFVICRKLCLHPENDRLQELSIQDGKYQLKKESQDKLYKFYNDLTCAEDLLFHEEELSKRERSGKTVIQKITDETKTKPIEFGFITANLTANY